MNAPSETLALALEYDLPHSPAKVWRALTEPELLARWLLPNDLRPAAGQRFTFRGEPAPWWDGVVHCEVLEIEPHKRLRYTWQSGKDATRVDTVVTWTLTATATGTRLALEHSGFRPGQAYAASTKGWQRLIGKALTDLLAAID